MNVFSVNINGWQSIVISINWLMIVVIVAGITIALSIFKCLRKRIMLKTFKFEEATIGIGNSSVTIKYDGRVKEIAYKIWIELTTRKIGLEFDEKYDVISEVYDSWYEAFRIIRGLLEEIPADRINDAKGLINLTTKVLNNGLRPHLTMWQAKYRVWYEKALKENKDLSPQEIQKDFPEYELLVEDLKKTNEIMMKYADQLNSLIDTE